MNLSKIFEKIESVDFAIDFTVISGFRVLRRALEENKTLLSVIRDLRLHPDHKNTVLERLITTFQAEHPADFQHPNDIAIAAYFFVLYKADPSLALGIAEQLSNIPNLWWARLLAEFVVETMSTGDMEMSVQISEGSLQPLPYRIFSTPLVVQNYEALWGGEPTTHGLPPEVGSYQTVTHEFIPFVLGAGVTEMVTPGTTTNLSASSGASKTLRLPAMAARAS